MNMADSINSSVASLKDRLAKAYAEAIARMLTSPESLKSLAEAIDELDGDTVVAALTDAAKDLLDDWDGEVAE